MRPADNPNYPHLAERFDKIARELLSAVRAQRWQRQRCGVLCEGGVSGKVSGRSSTPCLVAAAASLWPGAHLDYVDMRCRRERGSAGLCRAALCQAPPPAPPRPQLPDPGAVASLQATPQGVVRSFYPLKVTG